VAYLFATPDQQQEMLRKIGVDSIDALFDGQVPREVRLNRPLNLPPPLTELRPGHQAACWVQQEAIAHGKS